MRKNRKKERMVREKEKKGKYIKKQDRKNERYKERSHNNSYLLFSKTSSVRQRLQS